MRYCHPSSATPLPLGLLFPALGSAVAGRWVQAGGRSLPEPPPAPVNPALCAVAAAHPDAGQVYLFCASDS